MKISGISGDKFYKFVYAPLLFPFVWIPAQARYYFDKWDTNNGLPQNTVGAIRGRILRD
jgi:hypothetical protein